jgi:hypothetical protein
MVSIDCVEASESEEDSWGREGRHICLRASVLSRSYVKAAFHVICQPGSK